MDLIVVVDIVLALVLIVTLIRFATQMHRLGENAARLEATVDRMERATEVVAHDLRDKQDEA